MILPLKKNPVVAVDPGIHGLGVSYYYRGVLVAAAYLRGLPAKATPDHIKALTDAFSEFLEDVRALPQTALVLEWPRVYLGGAKGADPNDLLWLTAVDGALAADWPGDVQLVEPHGWKGNMPTETVLLGRIRGFENKGGRLAAQEEEVFDKGFNALPKSLSHNFIDGVGIGLWAVGRL